jgi:single-strand DNA-binding protein
MNLVILSGNLARDPEKSYTNSGMSVTRFTIAVNRFSRKEGGQDADFIRITCFDKQADLVEKYLTKGSKVAVEARVQTGSYQGKDGNTVYTTDFIANRVEFMDRKRDTDGGGFGGQFSGQPDAVYQAPAERQEASSLPGGFEEIDDNDMPF